MKRKKNKIYKIYTITKSLTAEKMGEVEARKLEMLIHYLKINSIFTEEIKVYLLFLKKH